MSKSRKKKLPRRSIIDDKINCDHCRKPFNADKLIFGPDPFALAIYYDETEVALCGNCYDNLYDEI